ncbi:diphthine--ammonia ligase [Candidatus Methanoliparum sp. LAM-1]|nr:diphthine--ammonia ligase [Candidatus Methanoliparum sp. LAM-1]
MKLAALVSGGKDSLYATYLASKRHEIRVIVTIKSLNPESYMYHVPNIDLVKLQAKAMRLPLIFKHSMGKKEEELIDLKDALLEAKEEYGIEGVVSGAIFSRYQKERIDGICNELCLKSLAPLWKRKPKELWNEMFKAGFEVIISAVAAYGLTEEWLGQLIDREAFNKLCDLHDTCYVCIAGEGGEFETFVIYCPLFKERIIVEKSKKTWDRKTTSGKLIIEKAMLAV